MTDTSQEEQAWDELDTITVRNLAAGEQAAERCSFQLAYTRAATRRAIHPGMIRGDDIDDADTEGDLTSGTWNAADHPAEQYTPAETRLVLADEWIDHYASMAVNEAVHEALEWFHVDGERWLDPHGDGETATYDAVDRLCRALAKIRGDLS